MPADGAPRSTPSRRDAADLRRALARVLSAATGGRYRVELDVPGEHYSGLPHNELLAILAKQDRDFAHATTAMRAHVRATVALHFEGAIRLPSTREVDAVMDAAVVEWIVKRFDGKVRDQHLRLLTIPYAKAKAKAGYGSKSIGVRTGSLVAAVEDHGRVTIVR
jgi:hypothetical protein